MNLEEIKEIVQREGGKIVIVEQDKPQVVIMSYGEWKRGKRDWSAAPAPASAPASSSGPAVHEPAPRPPASPPPPTRPAAANPNPESLTIDDLPL